MLQKIHDNTLHFFDEMWLDYTKEIGVKSSDFETNENRSDYLIIHNKKIAGFALIGEYPDSFSPFDIFVQDFYIKPEFRNQGIGSESMAEIIDLHEAPAVSLFILDNNDVAYKFWQRLFNIIGFEDRVRAGGIIAKGDRSTFYYFVDNKDSSITPPDCL